MEITRVLGSHYRLGELIGRGAMGEVYVATDIDTGERLAAKVLRSEHTDDDEVTSRFLQERRLLRALEHPNIVRVRELVVDRDDIAIVMDLVDGHDLRRLLRTGGPLAPASAVRICADVLSALAMAHGLPTPVQHRDVKPDNILVGATDEHVFLTDFGVARLAEVGTGVRLTSGIGTADYMAPEMSGQVAGAPADVYAVGVTLYELLTGHTPFGNDSYQAVALRHLTCEPPAVAGLPPALGEVLTAMLVKRPDSRPDAATAQARLRALLPGLAGLPPLPPSPSPTEWVPAGQRGAVPAVDSAAADRSGGVTDAAGANELQRGTRLRGSGATTPQQPVAAVPGSVVGRVDAPAADELTRGTNLVDRSALLREHEAAAQPVIVPPAAASTHSRRRLLVVIGAVAAAVAIAVGVVVAVSGGSDDGGERDAAARPAAAADAQTVDVAGGTKTYVAPLTVTHSGTYDPSSRQLTVTVRFDAAARVVGPFLELVPPQQGAECPAVEPAGGTALAAYVDDDQLSCAQQITPPGGVLSARQSWTASYSFAFDAGTGDKARTAVARWLGAAASQLDSGLATFGRTSILFPVQRYAGFEPAVTSAVVAGRPVPIVVNPVWQGADTPDNNHPLYTPEPGASDSLARSLGLSIDIQEGAAGCGSATVSQRGSVATVTSSAVACNLDVRVGNDVKPVPTFGVAAG